MSAVLLFGACNAGVISAKIIAESDEFAVAVLETWLLVDGRIYQAIKRRHPAYRQDWDSNVASLSVALTA